MHVPACFHPKDDGQDFFELVLSANSFRVAAHTNLCELSPLTMRGKRL